MYMKENNGHCLGGEQSWSYHIWVKHATTGDGILTSLKVMGGGFGMANPLSKLASEVDIFRRCLKTSE